MKDALKYTDTPEKTRPSASTQARPTRGGDVGERLCLVRKKFNMSQKEMSSRFLISPTYLSELETGKKVPDGPLLVAIESVLMVDRKWLTTGKGEMPASPGSAFDETIDESAAVVELLTGYKTLSLQGKRKLLMFLEMLAPAQRKTRNA